MNIHSMRWRLALSYAGIACMAALALGAVLLAILRSYYAEQERQYLRTNAEGLTVWVGSAMSVGVPIDALEPQLQDLAFFSNIRIRLYAPEGNLLADSGLPDDPQILTFVAAAPDQTMGMALLPADGIQPVNPSLQPECGDFFLDQTTPGSEYVVSGGQNSDFIITSDVVPISSTMYGFSVGSSEASLNDEIALKESISRCNQQIQLEITGADNSLLGTVVVSDGPAYGSEIVNSVARGWALSGGVAVLLAALVGWFISRQITKPLLALTTTTTLMAAGDLSARAAVGRRDEVGMLASSFNHMADRIQEIVVTLQRFVADAAHELHTPITALRTNLELIEGEQAALRRAHEQVIRLQKLTDDLLNLSRIEAHSSNQPASPVDMLALTQLIGEIYASRAEQANIEMMLCLPDLLPAIHGYREQLEYVLANLLDNALKFTPSGGTITVTVRQIESALELVVQDTGIGIPAEDLPQLFERFRRGHNAAGYPGSGLGLAIVKAIVQGHRGSVSAENTDSGAAITVSLPIVTEQ